ncbi:hypothetical protein T07_6273 [Trichinella nelsoni]|uniref:Uncharacterized protein n=1 Tax=Trichinella nelsoni TaxID=6336 RepID=A0A0V0RGE8_9BILA|nr:hypothetical protein T07_6273 [Trichinella nelsoni]
MGQNNPTRCAAIDSMIGKCQKWESGPIRSVWNPPDQVETAQEEDSDITQMRKGVTSTTFPTRCPPDRCRTQQSLLSQNDQIIVEGYFVCYFADD